jgi:uncharacterized protein involved in type VI secretion and phage assembly
MPVHAMTRATATPTEHADASGRVERLENQVFGKHRGIVVANDDPEQLGRLRVWVPSLFPVDGDATPGGDDPATSDWAWPCAPFGGSPQTGLFMVPEVGAKVWVEYEEGNLDSPIWTGVFWSRPGGTSDVPTEAQAMDANAPQRRVLKTPSGHLLEFSDIDGEESITLRHKDGAVISFDAQGSVTIGNRNGTFVYLNAEQSELALSDENGNNLRLGDNNLTLTNADGTVVDLAGPAVQVVAKHVMLRSDTVSLGEGAMEPAILGRSFAAIFDAHVHPTAFGPSGPPLPVPLPLSAPTHPAMSKSVMVK